MTHIQGKCKCGHELHTFKVNWLMLIIGVIIGACLIGKPWGRSIQLKAMQAEAPNYYKESLKQSAKRYGSYDELMKATRQLIKNAGGYR